MIPDTTKLTIGGRAVGQSHPPFVIAEIGLNHGGSVDRGLALVDAAADAGASAIKLQTLDAAFLVAEDAPPPAHVAAASMVEFFRTFELDEPAHRALVSRARARGLAVLATPLSERAVTMLSGLGVDAFKIASGDVTYARLIRACGASGKPVVISTGMSDLDEVGRARRWALEANARGVALLHCVSSYPVPSGHQNLRAIATLANRFKGPVGLSDHAADAFAWSVAVALGASIYERHLVLDRNDGSIDAAVSSTPDELSAAINDGLRAWHALGSGDRTCGTSEQPNRVPSRRALYATRTLPAGHTVTPEDVVALRPSLGLAAEHEDVLVGRRLTRAVARGAAFQPTDISESTEAGRVA